MTRARRGADAPSRRRSYRLRVSLLARAQERAGSLADWLPALLLTAAVQAEVWAGGEVSSRRGADALVLLAATVPLAWRRRAPVAVVAIVTVGLALGSPFLDGYGTPLLAVLVAVYSLGAHAGGRARDIGVAVVVVAVGATQIVTASRGDDPAFPGLWVLLALPFVIGCLRRWQRLDSVRLREHAAQLEREREEKARLAVAAERARIARELHDVVAHAISLIVVQARAGRRTTGGQAGPPREAFDAIEGTGRLALAEMRRLVGLLRTDGEGPELAPHPGLDQLDGLIAQVSEAGLPVELRTDGEATELPPGIDVSAYRIVQEALTNALKHAGPASARVIIHYRPDELELEVIDTGTGGQDAGAGGHGLVGMRERVSVYGGEIDAGESDGGGFAVRARLPLQWAQP
jgi:signal transduction histidine kinase